MTFQTIDVEIASRAELIAHIDALEALLDAYGDSDADRRVAAIAAAFSIEPNMARVIDCLRDGEPHSKNSILGCIYRGRIDDEPGSNIIDVYVSKVRSATWRYGIEIATLWGYGYRMMAGEDVVATVLGGADPVVTRHGKRKPGAQGDRKTVAKRRQVADLLAHLRARQQRDAKGALVPFRIASRNAAFAAGINRPAGGAIRELEERGLVEVVEAAKRGSGVWRLRVTEKGMRP